MSVKISTKLQTYLLSTKHCPLEPPWKGLMLIPKGGYQGVGLKATKLANKALP